MRASILRKIVISASLVRFLLGATVVEASEPAFNQFRTLHLSPLVSATLYADGGDYLQFGCGPKFRRILAAIADNIYFSADHQLLSALVGAAVNDIQEKQDMGFFVEQHAFICKTAVAELVAGAPTSPAQHTDNGQAPAPAETLNDPTTPIQPRPGQPTTLLNGASWPDKRAGRGINAMWLRDRDDPDKSKRVYKDMNSCLILKKTGPQFFNAPIENGCSSPISVTFCTNSQRHTGMFDCMKGMFGMDVLGGRGEGGALGIGVPASDDPYTMQVGACEYPGFPRLNTRASTFECE